MFHETPWQTLGWTAAFLGLISGAAFFVKVPSNWPFFVALVMAASLVLAVIVWRGRLSTGWVLGVALVLRLGLAGWPPVLSDDAYRYVWDGMLQAEGINPYRQTPDDASLARHHSDSLYQVLNSTAYHTVYPPVSQVVFFVGGLFYEQGWIVSYYVIKSLLIGFEVGALIILSRLVAAPALALYAWHPLVLIETAGQSHTESAMLFFIAAVLLLSKKGKGGWAGAALAGAGWTKLYPFVFFPFLMIRQGWKTALAGGVVAVALLVPYWHPAFLANIRSSLDLYVQYFEFNAGFYYGVKKLFLLATGEDWSKQLGPAFRALFLVSLAAIIVYDARKMPALSRTLLLTTTVFILFSTTVHPWYLAPVLMLAVLEPRTPWHYHWLASCSIGTYLLYIEGPYWAFVNLAWWGWLVIGLIMYRQHLVEKFFLLMRLRATQKAKRILHFLPRKEGRPLRVLDFGAAEGYVGEFIHRRTGAEVTLADVEDLNRTKLQHVRYDGRRLPFDDGVFDAVLLYFVLHHCEDPEHVLNEALRVSSGRVVVVESVYLTEKERKRLVTLDKLANRIRSLGVMRGQEPFLHFRRAEEWKQLGLSSGANWVAEGEWGHVLHRQYLFVLDKLQVPPSKAEGQDRYPVP
jgi:alpha-1,6-mannosyltransferase